MISIFEMIIELNNKIELGRVLNPDVKNQTLELGNRLSRLNRSEKKKILQTIFSFQKKKNYNKKRFTSLFSRIFEFLGFGQSEFSIDGLSTLLNTLKREFYLIQVIEPIYRGSDYGDIVNTISSIMNTDV